MQQSQVNVKFLFFKDQNGKLVKRYQFTAIDDATRIRALKIYERHNQTNAIDFVKYVIDKLPFHIPTIQTYYVHEFQSKFHCHCYINPRPPNITVRSNNLIRGLFFNKLTFFRCSNVMQSLSNKASSHLYIQIKCQSP